MLNPMGVTPLDTPNPAEVPS